ncbi:MAG: ATP-binding domain-containing protein, partial [Clostridia bacterium]|nr:ATP-binding domain-containing protein [Clostridia bacterium]
EDANAVVLMTVHSAKGLEFPVVFIAGAEEGIFPGYRTFDHPEELPEERRLAYVAVTRAKERLFVTAAAERLLYGRTTYGELSRFFAKEVRADLIHREYDEKKRSSFGDRVIPPQNKRYAPQPAAEWNRAAGVSATQPKPRKTAADFGLHVFKEGDRVRHVVLGTGTVLQAKEMGGDCLYTVRFDSGVEKRLMATYAKLTAE